MYTERRDKVEGYQLTKWHLETYHQLQFDDLWHFEQTNWFIAYWNLNDQKHAIIHPSLICLANDPQNQTILWTTHIRTKPSKFVCVCFMCRFAQLALISIYREKMEKQTFRDLLTE